jgi:hypothetical protein
MEPAAFARAPVYMEIPEVSLGDGQGGQKGYCLHKGEKYAIAVKGDFRGS